MGIDCTDIPIVTDHPKDHLMHNLIKQNILIKNLTHTDALFSGCFYFTRTSGGDALSVVIRVFHGETLISLGGW